MATPRKKKAVQRKVRTVADESYSKLDMYCIWLQEFYTSLMKAGFKEHIARSIIVDREAYPDWVEWRLPTDLDIEKYLDEEED